MGELPTINLGMELVRVTEAAAMAAGRWMGRDQKEAGDQSAVNAMRLMLSATQMDGLIIIGEGEKDEAPMLFSGEEVGDGTGPKMDVAVDPIDGTTLLAKGKANAIAVIATSPRGTMWNPGPGFYMEKMVVGHEAKDVIDLNTTVGDNLRAVAKALKKDVRDLTVFVMERSRHQKIIAEIAKAGARVALHSDGDVAGALMAANPHVSGIDMMINIGGTPEGVIAACAIKALGGQILGRLAPQSEKEKIALQDAGLELDRILNIDDMVNSDDVFFAATGITDGQMLKGVKYEGGQAHTYSMVIRGHSGSVRFIEAIHKWEKLLAISDIEY